MNMPPESAEVATLADRKAFPFMARVTAEGREDSQTTIAECARYYKSHDWSPIPVRSRTKQPTVKGWQNLEISEEQIESYFHNDSNIGLRLGEPSGWLVDIDLDAGQAVSLADRFLPKTRLIHGRPGKLRSHYWYVAPESQTEKFKDVDGTMLVELRSTGAQTVVPPSIHPSGEELFWKIQEEPAPLDCHELRKAVAELAACALVSRHWFPKDNRNAGAMALAGYLLRHGIAEYRVVKFVEGAACIAGDEETSARVRTTLGTATKLAAGGRITGGPTLETLLSGDGSAVVERLSEWMGLEGSHSSSQPSEWPDPQTLPEGLLPVPALQDVMVPEPPRLWIADITERMQCPLEFATVGAVVAIASLIGRRLAVRPKRQDDWQVVPNLWGGVVERPGIMKSPALAEAIKPLHRLERRGRELYEAEIKEFETRRIAIKAKKADIESQIKTAVRQGGDPAVVASEFTLPSEQDDSPTVSRFIVNDPTIEKLGELLNENPRGLLLFRDELTGWLKSMEREGHESDRSFYLEGWGGTG